MFTWIRVGLNKLWARAYKLELKSDPVLTRGLKAILSLTKRRQQVEQEKKSQVEPRVAAAAAVVTVAAADDDDDGD